MAESIHKTQVATGATAKTVPAASTPATKKAPGIQFRRYFTKPGTSPYDQFQWELRTASITDAQGKTIFEQKNVETPKDWSMTATNIVASKYLHGAVGTPERESGVRALVGRVAETIRDWGVNGRYFATRSDADTFHDELAYILLDQRAAFNSPVWFNVGCDRLEPNSDAQNWHWNPELGSVQFGVTGYRNPQCSACFINSVKDSLDSILTLAKTEGMLFKFGSGTGTNLSGLRSSTEQLSGGGTASGPVSFMRGYDSFAGSIKSGGTTRRAAKMVILNADHPDVLDFIRCKAEEEKKAWALIEAGYNVGFNVPGGAYDSVQFQNANHSVRITDTFMNAVADDKTWETHAIVGGRTIDTYKARTLWREIADAAWICGDPGLQFDTTIQDWNVVPNTGRINATNPCSEFVFLDDTACNLLSLNLMKFQSEQGTFDVERFQHAVDICFTGQEILVSNASYPTPAIGKNSDALRPLGLGYANIGALLMSMGLAYDSDEGRRFAGAITAIMTGRAFAQSARMAQVKGPFGEYAKNREPMLRVMEKHRAAAHQLTTSPESADVIQGARDTWDDAVKLGRAHGYRNAQATVLAPTGTIGLMMDCDTTGIEPDLALVKYKKLVGGGLLKIVNTTVPAALRKLGYDSAEVKEIVEYIDENDTIEGAPHLQDEHLKVFDCAFKPVKGARSIAPMGHVRMMAAVQPFISGSMSKTVNLPTDATVEEIEQTYMESWNLGLKCIAIYRDGCKRSQPLSTSLDKEKKATPPAEVEYRAMRRKLPDERKAVTHKFDLGGHEGYLTVGLYEDGTPGELFVTMAKEGSTISGLMDAFATQTSYALQFGVPLKFMVDKFTHMRFEPSGFTKNQEIPIAKSIVDYIFRWMASHFLPLEDAEAAGVIIRDQPPAPDPATGPGALKIIATPKTNGNGGGAQKIAFVNTDAPACPDCGAITVRSGSCYKCLNCGATTGCS